MTLLSPHPFFLKTWFVWMSGLPHHHVNKLGENGKPSEYYRPRGMTNQLSKMEEKYIFFPTLRNYDFKKQLLPDVIAGLTVGSLAIPQSMSYAMIAGLPIQNGLYSDLQVAYPILGTSRHLVVGPVAIMSLLTFGTLKGLGMTPLTEEWSIHCSFLSLLVAFDQSIISIFRLGDKLSNAVSENTIKAFTISAAITIMSTQIRALLGVKCGENCSSMFDMMSNFFSQPNLPTLAFSISSFIILEGFRYIFSAQSMIPKLSSLFIIFFSCSIITLFPIDDVAQVGYIPQGLPSDSPVSLFPSTIRLDLLPYLFLYSIPISLVGFAEAYAIARARTDKSTLNPDQELLALALANIWTSILGGYPITGSFSRSAVNAESGCTSSASNFVAALVVVFVLQVFTQFLAKLPKSCVSAIVIFAIIKLIDFNYLKATIRQCLKFRTEKTSIVLQSIAYFIVVFTALFFGVEIGLVVGFVLDTCIYLFIKFYHRQEIAEEKEIEQPENAITEDWDMVAEEQIT